MRHYPLWSRDDIGSPLAACDLPLPGGRTRPLASIALRSSRIMLPDCMLSLYGVLAYKSSWSLKGMNTASAEVAAFDPDTAEAQRQRGHQSVLLLKSSWSRCVHDAGRLRNGDLQLLGFVGARCSMEKVIEHLLVAALQPARDFSPRRRRWRGRGRISRSPVRPSSAPDLHGVQIGDLALDHLDGLILVDAVHAW